VGGCGALSEGGAVRGGWSAGAHADQLAHATMHKGEGVERGLRVGTHVLEK